jgi:cytochrome c553
MLCKFCHGSTGNSRKSTIPNLASQNTTYLIRQFELFATGQRKNRTMNEMSRLLTPEDKVNIALFFSRQKIKPQHRYRPELAEKGKKIFSLKCFFCHGKNAYGKETLPRIASQPADYVVRTLNSYNSSLNKRADTDMTRVARALKKDEIQALAAYLTTLQ